MIPHTVVYPSADPKRGLETAYKWRAQGYNVVMGVDSDSLTLAYEPMITTVQVETPFPGYYRAINHLVNHAIARGAVIVTCIGDDMEPPITSDGQQTISADTMAMLYLRAFPDLYGVMQPCGDPGGTEMSVKGHEDLGPIRNAARICGSPIFGFNWFKTHRFCEDYKSFYADEDLWNVARKEKKLALVEDIMHKHNHWTFGLMEKQPYHDRAQVNWEADKATFERRKAAGFP